MRRRKGGGGWSREEGGGKDNAKCLLLLRSDYASSLRAHELLGEELRGLVFRCSSANITSDILSSCTNCCTARERRSVETGGRTLEGHSLFVWR